MSNIRVVPRATIRLGLLVLVVALANGGWGKAADSLPKMKFNEVKEIAPGVFFRYSSISATDKSVPFGGSNNTWIVFDDYVVVIDANFPKEAGDVIEAIGKTTEKPIRYVFDTHHHGDHAYGNAVFAGAGASVIAQTNCARLLRVNGPKEFAEAGQGPTGRKDIAESKLKVPNVIFDDKFVLDDGTQRVEFLFMGHGHTAGDAVAYLPKHRILCTGDACVNGAFNFMGHSDSASWVRALEKMQQLDVKMVCPGHGAIAGKDLLERQKRYFVELRQRVAQGIHKHQNVEDILKNLEMAWYKQWTGVTPAGDNVKHVYAELTGRVAPWNPAEEFGLSEGPSANKEASGWTKPKRIVVPAGLMPARLGELKRIAPEVEFVPARTAEEAAEVVGDADAVVGFCTAEIVKAGKKLRWIQYGTGGIDKELAGQLGQSPVAITNPRPIYGPQVADQAMALLLALTRGIRPATANEPVAVTGLQGKTMVLVGLSGSGTQIARRSWGFGMRVRAVEARDMERPGFVFSLDKPKKLEELLGLADVVVVACALDGQTRGMFGARQFEAMKKKPYFINVGRAGLVQTDALAAALDQKQIAGAGLDVADADPLPADHPLAKRSNVVISPYTAGNSPEGRERQWRLVRENVRRFVEGEPLLGVVDRAKGY